MNLGSLRWGQKAIKCIIKARQEIVIVHMYIMYIHIVRQICLQLPLEPIFKSETNAIRLEIKCLSSFANV